MLGAGDEKHRWSWGQVTKLVADRKHRRSLVVALCVIPHEEDSIQLNLFQNTQH